MSTPFYTVNTTTATEFSYSLNGINSQILALTLTGFGTGFTYDMNDDVIGGVLDSFELSVTFQVTLPGLGPVTNTFVQSRVLEIDDTVANLLADQDVPGQPLRESLADEAVEFEVVPDQEIIDAFTFDASGMIIDGPNPDIFYLSDTGPKLGTATADMITFNGTGGRIDTLGGKDIVQFFDDGAQDHMRVALRNGDDLFYVVDGFAFGGAEDLNASTTWVNGGAGEDVLLGGVGRDELRGFNDDDVIAGQNGADRLFGGGGNDQIFGGHHDDVIFAGVGRDIVDAGLGDDVMTGGLGRDVFIFDILNNNDFIDPAATTESDIIQDFATGLDTLHFRQFGTDLSQTAAFSIFDANSVQSGNDTVFSFAGGSITLRNTLKTDFSAASFYDQPDRLPGEFDYFTPFLAYSDGF